MKSEFTIAVHSLVYLAYLPGHMASSEAIAHNVATNPARIRKVMSALRKEGLVRTKEGTRGGYMLGCDPTDITLADVYHAVSYGTLQPNWCTGVPDHSCPVSSNTQVVMDRIFSAAEDHYEAFLRQFTVASVLDNIKSQE
ncbi:transcriptional regulator [Domibacillus antri]|uniref:Transcriptional regulator n=1 Tax=Domibacillus antri TaxID=1714264 RepID=A0A1Q8Q5D5_9BACI|nr:Rrf2 family transcriptional regulator [Domibacillus antri]OLN22538.1 transcriptional regulator [Domibacillus antri]